MDVSKRKRLSGSRSPSPLSGTTPPDKKARRSRSPGSSSATVAPWQPVAVFLFRRDLRLCDNTGLRALCDYAAAAQLPVVPLFLFNPLQCEAARNPYFGAASFQFLCESLVDLDGPQQLHGHLVCLRGSDEECLSSLARGGLALRALGYNEDFTPFAAVRDERLRAWCSGAGVTVVTCNADYTLLPPTAVANQSGQPYSVFTAFYRRLLADHAKSIPRPLRAAPGRSHFLADGKARLGSALQCVDPASLVAPLPALQLHGGRAAGLELLARVPAMKRYDEERNDIPGDRTTHLAPHLKFGTVSVREVWCAAVDALGTTHGFPRQLVWREFYAMLLANHPQLTGGQLRAFPDYKSADGRPPAVNQPFMAKYLTYKWHWADAEFSAFKAGLTGVPLVDAGVRCVTATGWCHNRLRMVIANYLVKVLGVDWREGERWYATVAVDYDVANNSGGWLWSSGQGADAQPYFRTFNPFRQSERFDPECAFIYKWVPELRNIPTAVVHTWDDYCTKHKHVPSGSREKYTASGAEAAPVPSSSSPEAGGKGKPRGGKAMMIYRTSYPAPIVNARERMQRIIAEFKKYDPKK